MNWPKAKNLAVALLAAVNAIITALIVLDAVDWTFDQGALVYGIANALSYLVLSIYAHTMPRTKREPVNVAASISATAVAVLAWGNGFEIWWLDETQQAAIISVVGVLIGVVTATLARQNVTAPMTPAAPDTPDAP